MKYAIFPVSEEAKINEFLALHGGHIAQNGVYMSPDSVRFIYADESEAERAKKVIAKSIKDGILEKKIQLAGQETDVRYWRGESMRSGENKAADQVAISENQKRSTADQIKRMQELLADIESGEYVI